MVFCEVITVVIFSRCPKHSELALADTVTNPVKAHVNCFGSFLFDCVVDDAFGTSVVGLDRSGGLFVAEELQCVADHAGILGVVEEGSDFCFGGRGHDIS